MGFFSGRGREAAVEPFTWTNSGLRPDQLSLIALAGPYLRGTGPVDTLADREAVTRGRAVDRRYQQAWGITDTGSAVAAIEGLIAGTHAPLFAQVGEQAMAAVLRSDQGGAVPQPLPHDIWAYDLGRAANLIRVQHGLGRLPEPEAGRLLVAVGHQASQHYRTWADYGRAHLAGRAFWLVTQGATHRIDGEMRLGQETLRLLLDHPQGPWRLLPFPQG